VKTLERPPGVLSEPEWRVEGRDKVTGAARYAADVRVPNMLHAAFVSSPHAHARIVKVDASAARGMLGVRAVITGADVRPARYGRRLQDWPVLCWDHALFIGDRVAAVAADTPEIADAAARAISVEYEELPAVLDPEAALAEDASVLHPDPSPYLYLGGKRPTVPNANVQGYGLHEHGDVDAAFASAHRTFEHRFTLARTHQGYIEPHATLLWLDGDVVRVVSTNKAPYGLRQQMAACLGLPEEKIVVDAGHIGGDFGGKGHSIDEFVLYYLARATGRPVRAVMRYADELQMSATRHGGTITLRTGVDREGKFVAHSARVVFDGGAYAAGKPVATLMPGEAMVTLAGYHLPNVRVEAMTVYTNQIPAGHSRAPGQPQNVFAAESHVDLIARELGLDPLELRERNAIRGGEIDVEGDVWHDSTAHEVLATLRREARWDAARGRGHGRGIALGARPSGRGKSAIALRLDREGRVEVLTAVADQGGGQHTLFQRIVAAELGIPLDRITVRRGTTENTPRDAGIGGSRVTPVQGGAALEAARKLKAKLDEVAPGAPFAEAARRAAPLEIVAEHTSDANVNAVYAYALEVEVDRDTGHLRVLDAVLVADVGTVINPVAARGQLEGGFIFGLGQALMEELRVEDGRVTTTNLGDYKLPTIADAPPLRIVLLTDSPGPGPFGAKSVGELSNPGVGAAVANAVHDACGARVFSLPVTAEKVFSALRTERRAGPQEGWHTDAVRE